MNLTQDDFLGEYDSPIHEPEWFDVRKEFFKNIVRKHLMAMSESHWLEIRQEALANRYRIPGTDDMTRIEILAMTREDVITQAYYWTGYEKLGIDLSANHISTIGNIEEQSLEDAKSLKVIDEDEGRVSEQQRNDFFEKSFKDSNPAILIEHGKSIPEIMTRFVESMAKCGINFVFAEKSADKGKLQ